MERKYAIPKYNFKAIEKRWQKYWLEKRVFQPDLDKAKKPFYNLMMFPYPSAEGLHVGSVFTFSGVDTFGRFKKLQGYDVFEPIGLDGFGIHSENYAMKIGEHISDVSKRTEKHFYEQLKMIGNMHDWSRTVETYKPDYYKWTQWIFLKMYERGLAYRKKAKVNWCPSCKTVLSDEQVIAGRCERCDSEVQKKELAQWFFKITDYADRLLKNLDWIDWPQDVKTNQRNWIGKSEGATIRFEVKSQKSIRQLADKNTTQKSKLFIEVFTTRPDTLFGATYMVVAPEHEIISNFKFQILNIKEVEGYVKKAINKTEEERKNDKKEKTGVELKGIKAINPATQQEIPIFVADYVLGDYGTGAIMAVPAHDERDFQFAVKYKLLIKKVVQRSGFDDKNQKSELNPPAGGQNDNLKVKSNDDCFEGEGVAINSGFLNGLATKQAKGEMVRWLEKTGNGKKSIDYKLRDWCISRQRYWGPPIPIVWCKNCAIAQAGKKKIKVLIIHGFEGSGNGNWFLWMKKKLEKEGCEVFTPTIKKTDSKHPKIDNWTKQLKPYLDKLDENSTIIGHSLGSKAALHLLEKNNKKIAKLFLVASAIGNPRRDWSWLEKKWPNSDVDALKKFWEQQVDWKKIDQLVDEKHIIISKDDGFIDPEHYKVAQLNNLKVEKWDKQGHFAQKKNEKLKKYLLSYLRPYLLDSVEPVAVPVPEKDLPVKLPPMEDFLPEGKGKGPLAKNEKFVKTKCPVCGGEAERETDVSDPFVDSSWYFFRYPSTEFKNQPFDKKRTKKWLPVDSYIGGKEHTVLHLLYSRFVTMVFKDLGLIEFEEPYKRFFGHGLITKDGAKMSKSKGNVINPDEMIEKYGADTVRLYLRFVGDFSQGGDWRDSGIEGMARFVGRLWRTFYGLQGRGAGTENINMVDKTLKVISEDIEKLSFNTAVARLMEFVNWINENISDFDEKQSRRIKETLAFVLAPMAPHLAEEFWSSFSKTSGHKFVPEHKESIFNQKWPKFDQKNVIDEEIELVIQVNGRLRDKIRVPRNLNEEKTKDLALESAKVKKFLEGKAIRKFIFIPGKLVNLVV